MLLLNGIMMSMAAWEPVAAALAHRHRIIRADFRGQLCSPGDPPGALDGHAADLVRLLDHLRLDTVHVAGTSFGGLVGLTLAAQYPGRVRSLVAITTTDHMTPAMWTATQPLLEATRRAAAGSDKGAVFDAIVPATFSPRWRAAQDKAIALRRQVIAALPSGWFTDLTELLWSIRAVDLRPVLGRIVCPVLVVGAGQDLMFPLAHARALAEAIPRARLEVIAGASHGFVVEEPDRTASLIEAFVASVEN